jgi:hypothetical protein
MMRPITQSTSGGGGCGKWIRPKKQVRLTGGVGVHLWDDILIYFPFFICVLLLPLSRIIRLMLVNGFRSTTCS